MGEVTAMAKRVVIIGAGPGGLASAMLLAKAGLQVTVLERMDQVGGRTSALRMDGYTFDLGPTFFLYPQAFAEIFALCGADMGKALDLRRVDPQYRLVFGDGSRLDCTADLPRMEANIRALAPGDVDGFRRFLADNRRKLAAVTPCLQHPFESLKDIFTWRMLKLFPKLRLHRSIWDELSGFFRDERMRLACTFQAKYLGMSPWTCPSMFSILSFLEYEHGIWHPIGGLNAITRAMADTARGLGVDIRLGEEATGLTFAGRRVTGVDTAQGHHACDSLVINADFARAMTRLVPDRLRRRWSDAAIARKRFSCSTFMLYLGVTGRYEHLLHHNICFAQDYRGNLDDIESRHVLSADPSFYIQNPSITDPTLAPAGNSTLYVLVPVSHQHDSIDWTVEAPRFRARIIERMKAQGMPDIESRIRCERVVTPADWDAGMQIHLGATFNLAHNLGQMLHLRPRNRFEELDGVYLTGGGTHPGSGLPVIAESARIAARLLIEDLGMDGRFLLPPAG
jgi:phytoene desaturase